MYIESSALASLSSVDLVVVSTFFDFLLLLVLTSLRILPTLRKPLVLLFRVLLFDALQVMTLSDF